ncbi:type II secretion system protein [Methanobrevibacter sp.]|uniref:type II secretion system protein n=1 Tax=Methanobrevibacter sp. TaxID=66852 RepID=UPI003D7DD3CD
MMDNKGSITIEITVVLLIVLLIFGAILSSYENTTDKITKTQEKKNMEILTSEIVDNLINNPGVPEKWFEYDKGTPGLAITNEGGEIIPNSVSYSKLASLGKNYKKLVDEQIFKSKLYSSMELIPNKRLISSVKIGHDDESDNIFSVNRLVKCDFYKKYVLKDFQNDGKCNHNHNQEYHSCNYFKVFKGNLKSSDYYLLIDSSEKYDLKYIVDTTKATKENYWENTMSDKIYLNDKINFYDDTSAIVFIHFKKPQAKAVLVNIPKNFDKNKLKYDYFKTNECQFILKAWY